MSILYRIFSKQLRPNLLRLTEKSGIQVRLVTAMDVVTEDNKEPEIIVRNRMHTRFEKRNKKRQWEESNEKAKNCGESELKKSCDATIERIKRKKVVLMLGYCGVDYYGMQRNPGVRTIEEDLMKALWEAKYVTEEDFNNQQNLLFQRSSRTDKGVSAARQIVSLKLPLEVNIEEINKRLPECIRVFAVKRVTNKFNSKSKCNARTYSYTLPTYAFEPSLVSVEERKQYRITPEKIEDIKNVLAVYRGTKPYHNFTEKKHFQDPSASRYMMGFDIEKIFTESGLEFAVLLVKGQSFMLHQIRKMIGLAIAVIRGHADRSVLDKVFGKEKVMIPTAPGLGLVLDKVHYDPYDERYKNSHGALTWNEEEEAVQRFKHDHIYPVIVKGEAEENSMGIWLDEKLVKHSYEPSEQVPEDKQTENDEIGDDDDDDDDDKMDNDDEDVRDRNQEIKKPIPSKTDIESIENKSSTQNDDVLTNSGGVKCSENPKELVESVDKKCLDLDSDSKKS